MRTSGPVDAVRAPSRLRLRIVRVGSLKTKMASKRATTISAEADPAGHMDTPSSSATLSSSSRRGVGPLRSPSPRRHAARSRICHVRRPRTARDPTTPRPRSRRTGSDMIWIDNNGAACPGLLAQGRQRDGRGRHQERVASTPRAGPAIDRVLPGRSDDSAGAPPLRSGLPRCSRLGHGGSDRGGRTHERLLNRFAGRHLAALWPCVGASRSRMHRVSVAV